MSDDKITKTLNQILANPAGTVTQQNHLTEALEAARHAVPAFRNFVIVKVRHSIGDVSDDHMDARSREVIEAMNALAAALSKLEGE